MTGDHIDHQSKQQIYAIVEVPQLLLPSCKFLFLAVKHKEKCCDSSSICMKTFIINND